VLFVLLLGVEVEQKYLKVTTLTKTKNMLGA